MREPNVFRPFPLPARRQVVSPGPGRRTAFPLGTRTTSVAIFLAVRALLPHHDAGNARRQSVGAPALLRRGQPGAVLSSLIMDLRPKPRVPALSWAQETAT